MRESVSRRNYTTEELKYDSSKVEVIGGTRKQFLRFFFERKSKRESRIGEYRIGWEGDLFGVGGSGQDDVGHLSSAVAVVSLVDDQTVVGQVLASHRLVVGAQQEQQLGPGLAHCIHAGLQWWFATISKNRLAFRTRQGRLLTGSSNNLILIRIDSIA